jgi:hypothetical protein
VWSDPPRPDCDHSDFLTRRKPFRLPPNVQKYQLLKALRRNAPSALRKIPYHNYTSRARGGNSRISPKPKNCLFSTTSKLAPHPPHRASPLPTAPWHAWHISNKWATPGVRLANSQNCRVVGPRTTLDGVNFPLSASARITPYEHPGRNGCSRSRINHAPMWFCVACLERGSKCPRHDSHRSERSEGAPQYGHKTERAPCTSCPPSNR